MWFWKIIWIRKQGQFLSSALRGRIWTLPWLLHTYSRDPEWWSGHLFGEVSEMCPVPLQLAAGSSQCLSYPDLGGEFAPFAASGAHESQVINSGPAQSPHLVKIRYGFYLHTRQPRCLFLPLVVPGLTQHFLLMAHSLQLGTENSTP